MMVQPSNHDVTSDTKTFHIVSCSDGLGIANVGPACLVLWREAVTEARFLRQRLALDEVVARHPRNAGFVCVIEPTAAPPDEHLRKASTTMIAGYGDRLRWVVCVIESSGFRAAVARSVLSGMALALSGRTPDTKFTASLAAAIPWITAKCGSESALQLTQAQEELRLRLSIPPTG